MARTKVKWENPQQKVLKMLREKHPDWPENDIRDRSVVILLRSGFWMGNEKP